ncbi:MAG: GFA family protein [Pseudomonadota bacterium]
MKFAGSCLCGTVKFQVNGNPLKFYTCHCSRCQKETGSAFASNLIFSLDAVEWTSGQAGVTRYEHSASEFFCSDFCSICGSTVAYLGRRREFYIVPAGSLDEKPELHASARIFWKDRPDWIDEAMRAPAYDGYWDQDAT